MNTFLLQTEQVTHFLEGANFPQNTEANKQRQNAGPLVALKAKISRWSACIIWNLPTTSKEHQMKGTNKAKTFSSSQFSKLIGPWFYKEQIRVLKNQGTKYQAVKRFHAN